MATLDDVAQLVKSFAYDAPDDLIKWHVVQAAREFCAKTRWLRESIIVPVITDQTRYALSPTDGSTVEIIEVKAVEWYGEPLEPKLQEEVADDVFGFYYVEPPATLVLSWIPDEDVADQLEVRVVLQTLLAITAIPDEIARRWDRALSYGALERLLMMKDASWFWPEGSANFAARWMAELGRAQVEADREMTRQGFRVVSYS